MSTEEDMQSVVTSLQKRIADLEQQVQSLQQHESHLRLLVEHTQDAMIVISHTGTIQFVNPAAEAMFGIPSAELVGQEVGLPAVDGDKTELGILFQYVPRYMAEMRVVEIEWDGQQAFLTSFLNITSHKQLETSLERQVEERTKMLHHAAWRAMCELEERHKIEKALNESEQKFRSFFEQSKDGLVLVDDQGTIIAWNQGSEDILGLKREDVIGKPRWDAMFQLVPDEQRTPEVYERIKTTTLEFIRSGGTSITSSNWTEHIIQCPDGRRIAINSLVFPIQIGQRTFAGGILRDVTDRHQHEEELREARQVAEAAARAKAEFLANMSHEIRTPMNAVIGMTNLLLDTPLNGEQRDYTETIRISGEALLNIINDILDFSKIEAGKLELERCPFDLRNCIEEAIELVIPQAADKDLDMTYVLDSCTPACVRGDITRLRQILVNLLSNAIKFTEHGEIVVSAQAVSQKHQKHQTHDDLPDATGADDGESKQSARNGSLPYLVDGTPFLLQVSVSDTGIGIPPDRLSRLFQSFSQVDASTTRKHGGTGLGLAISKRLSEIMGGTMWVESEPGKGSTFHFTIRVEQVVEQNLLHQDMTDGVDPGCLHQKRVLMVGPSSSTHHQVLRQRLQSWGMHVQLVEAGDEVWPKIRGGGPFDVVLCNIRAPSEDSLKLARDIQQVSGSSHLPVLLFVSPTERNSARHQISDNASWYCLARPVRVSLLYNTLVEMFTDSQEGAPEPPAAGKRPSPFAHVVSQPLHILLAEDNVVNQKIAVRLLERMGYRPDVVANGLEVLDAVKRQQYDVILMDVQMPEMDGVEATRHIRERMLSDDQPWIIAMTAYAMEGDREWCLEAGMDDYVRKPVRVEELIQALQRVPVGEGHSIVGDGSG